jgi:glycosyltransferase involved in cell wall biosynthesis
MKDARRPKVGFITESFLDEQGKLFEGGAERHLFHLAFVASDLGAEVTVYQRSPRPWQVDYDGISVVAQPARLSALGRVLGGRAMADGCTHLHFQYLERVPSGLNGPRVTATAHAVYWDIPYVAAYSQWYPGGRASALALPAWRVRQLVRSLVALARCERVLATDTTLLRVVQATWPALRQRIEVVPNFTDLHEHQPEEGTADGDPRIGELLAARLRGHVVVLVPRNLSFVRGGAWLCHIVQLTGEVSEGRQCHFFLTGVAVDVYGRADRYRQLLQRQVDALPPEARHRLHLLGGVPRAAMRAAFRASDIVLVPTFANEGTSLAAIEALGEGIPVVATNVGGLNDVVQHGVMGLLVPPDPASLAEAVASLAADAPLRRRLGQAGRETVQATFTLEHWRARAERFARRAGWGTKGAEGS